MPPNLQPDMYAGPVQVPGSEMGTQPSTQDNYYGNTSFGLSSSFFSSQTDYDNGSFIFQDQGQAPGASNCPPSANFPESQWSQYDTRLDVPGSSRMHQAIAEEYASARRLADDVDQAMETSPSEHAPATREDELSPSNNNWNPSSSNNNWYNP